MTDIPIGDIPAIPMGDIPAYYAIKKANEVCLTYPEGSLTWQQLDQNSSKRAQAFDNLGVKQDDLVTVALPNSLAFHETMFALWKLGATPHVISYALTPQEITEIVDLANPKLTIGIEESLLSGHTAIPADLATEEYSGHAMNSKVAKHWRAMSSGGSTGRPKIIVEHNPALWGFDAAIVNMPMNSCVLNTGPLYHTSPFTWSHVALFQGNHLVGMDKFNANEALLLIEKYSVRWTAMVPTMMLRIWKLSSEVKQAYDLTSIETVLHLAAPMPIWLKEKWIDWLGAERILELYGGTESIGTTIISGPEWLEHKGSVGKANTDNVKILNDKGDECKRGEPGNICFERPPGTTAQYHYVGAKPILVKARWESLGDIGWMDEQGYLYLADRKADMIISGGANIYPAEVESALMEHPAVDTAVVIGIPDDDMGQTVHAIICLIDNCSVGLTEDSLREFLLARLVRYKTPRSYEFVDHPPRDDAGKTRRSQLIKERTNK